MNNKRKLQRKVAEQELRLIDSATGHQLGALINITTEGFMLIGDDPPEESRDYAIVLELHESTDGRDSIEFSALCLWVAPAAEPGLSFAGFQIIDIGDAETALLESMIRDWDEAP